MGKFMVKLKWNGKMGEGRKIDFLLPFLYYRKWKSIWNSIVKRDSSVVSLFAYLGKHIYRFTILLLLLKMSSFICWPCSPWFEVAEGASCFLEENFFVNTSVIKWCEGWICYWVWWKVRAAAPGVAEEYIAFHMKGKHVQGGSVSRFVCTTWCRSYDNNGTLWKPVILHCVQSWSTVRPRLSGHIGTSAYPDKWFGRIWEIYA